MFRVDPRADKDDLNVLQKFEECQEHPLKRYIAHEVFEVTLNSNAGAFPNLRGKYPNDVAAMSHAAESRSVSLLQRMVDISRTGQVSQWTKFNDECVEDEDALLLGTMVGSTMAVSFETSIEKSKRDLARRDVCDPRVEKTLQAASNILQLWQRLPINIPGNSWVCGASHQAST